MMPPLLLLVALSLPPLQEAQAEGREPDPVPAESIRAAAELIGLELTDAEIELMLRRVLENRRSYERMQAVPLDNSVPPALILDASLLRPVEGDLRAWGGGELVLPEAARPDDLEELAFADIATLASLIRSRQVSCEELTGMYLARLRRLDETLHCVVTLTEERALRQARELDRELADGRWRGPLHGIPWGAKDLLAVRGHPTTWGAKPFEDQVVDLDATVVERLDEAGAVLIAKLSLGALAWGDVWFGGRTRNPWNPEQGSSGSSAGPASATAAGAVAFAIGSETWGSIVSPSDRCGCSSLRPTFGRVSRHGAMALSWSLDKLGPICRSALDAAIVFDAIQGVDPRDPTTLAGGFALPVETDVEGMRVGVPAGAFEEGDPRRSVLAELEALGVELVELELPEHPVGDIMLLLNAEAATAFDELTRSGRDDELVRQIRRAWPNVFRASRMIPAVEYIRAQRLRTLLMQDLRRALSGVDAIVHPSFAGDLLAMTNLTGHPTFVAPCGFREDGTPFSISFTGRLFGEAGLLVLARAWQEATGHHQRHPG